jgi:hypothetical protein
MISRCEADHGRGNCEMSGLIAYPKCKSGYSPFGCCICRPTPPNCRAIGMNGGIDLSCAKKTSSVTPFGCHVLVESSTKLIFATRLAKTSSMEMESAQFAGPRLLLAGWTAAAKDDNECATVVTDRILSVGMLALTIASLGATSLVNMAKNSVEYAQLAKDWKKLIDDLKDVTDSIPFQVISDRFIKISLHRKQIWQRSILKPKQLRSR